VSQKVLVQLIDDLDGSEIIDGKGRTIPFALDGTAYEIDLSEDNEQKLVDALARYVGNARKAQPATAGSKRRGPRTVASRQENGNMRTWAKEKGYKVSERGRIPAAVVRDYEASHP
jgi:hypothetical protein